MAKQKYANLIFKTGVMLPVPVNTERWPPYINHKMVLRGDDGSVSTLEMQFNYVGVQHGVGAYVEREAP
jgi:hypothetical protein